MKKLAILVITMSAIVGFMLTPIAGSAATKNLTIGSTSTSSGHYPYFVAVAKVLNDYVPGVNATVVATGASMDNLKRIAKGQADMGLVTLDAGYMGYHALGNWKDAPVKKQRVMWLYMTTAVHYVARQDSGIKTLYELDKKKFHPSMRGSATESSTMTVMKSLGIAPDYYRGDTGDAVNMMKDNRIVAMCKSGMGKQYDASLMDIATFTPLRTLPFTDKEINKVSEAAPWISWISISAGTIKGMGDFKTMAMVNFVMGNEDIPEDIGYKAVKAACEHMDIQVAAFPAMKGLNIPAATLEALTSVNNPMPLHRGSVKYFKELGLNVGKELIP